MHEINIFHRKQQLRKLVTGATNLETCMRKYHGEARDGGYATTLLHVLYGDRR